MNSSSEVVPTEDLSALAWVHDELRRSLDLAHKALRRYLKEAEAAGASDVDRVDPSVLRQARTQVHQSAGALELVGQSAAAHVLRASEAALLRQAAKPQGLSVATVEAVERGSFALLDFLARRLAGKPVQALALFPQYKTLQELAGASRVHPADLWVEPWQWHEMPDEAVSALAPNANTVARIEREMLVLMRGHDRAAATRISQMFARLGSAAPGRTATLWRLAAAYFEAQVHGLLQADVYGKRLASRLLSQLRAGPGAEPSDRLAQDLLFFCAQADWPAKEANCPRLMAVRQAFGLKPEQRVDYDNPALGRFDPAWVAQARKRVGAAKELWSAIAGGELERLPGLAEPFSLVGDSMQRLYVRGNLLAQALQAAANQTLVTAAAPPPALAMEVATGLLYVEASLDDGDFDHPDMADRLTRLAQRIDSVRHGREAGPLDLWMEELYRRVSDRQTMGSVVQELRVALSEVEKQIDQYFRNPAKREVLIPVPAQLSSMRGVLSVLGLDQASQAVLRMRDDVDALANTEVDPQRVGQVGAFDRLADNLGVLSFLIDMVSVQPQMAKALFRFDVASGALTSVVGRAFRPSGFGELQDTQHGEASALGAVEPTQGLAQQVAQTAAQPEVGRETLGRELDQLVQQARAADQTELADGAEQARQSLQHAAVDPASWDTVRAQVAEQLSNLTGSPATAPAPLAPLPVASPGAAGATGLEEDDEMREVFLEEAREVIASARQGLQELQHRPDDVAQMTGVRRGFHTLKGSSRMVGLKDFGEAAWACEQLFNSRLADHAHADADLREFSVEALDYLHHWVEAISQRRAASYSPADLVPAADALRLTGQRQALGHAWEQASEQPKADFELTLPPLDAVAEAPAAASVVEGFELALPELAPPAPPSLLSMVPDLPSAQALELDFALEIPGAGTTDSAAPADLALIDLAEQAVAPAAPLAPSELQPDISFDLLLEPDPATEPMPHSAVVAALIADDALALPDSASLPAEELAIMASAAPAPLVLAAPPDLPVDAVPQTPSWQLRPDELPQVIELSEIDFALDLDLSPQAVPTPAVARPDTQALAAPPEAAVVAEIAPHDEHSAVSPVAAAALATALHDSLAPPPAAPAPSPARAPETPAARMPQADTDVEQYKVIGPLRISITLFNIYLNEADELSRRLVTELAEWALELYRPVADTAVALAHSLAGSSATVGYADLSHLARALEHALMRSQARGQGYAAEAALYSEAAQEVRHLLHQFAAGFLKPVQAGLLPRLSEHEPAHLAPADAAPVAEVDVAAAGPALVPALVPAPAPAVPLAAVLAPEVSLASLAPMALPASLPEPATTPPAIPDLRQPALTALSALPEVAPRVLAARRDALDAEDDIDAVDTLDEELFPIFEEEALELLPQLQSRMRDWTRRPSEATSAAACMRTLHTLKGGARLAGAMRLGELAHRLETAIEHLLAMGSPGAVDVERLVGRVDAIEANFEQLRQGLRAEALAAPSIDITALDDAPAAPAVASAAALPVAAPEPLAPARPAQPSKTPLAAAAAGAVIDWSRFASGLAATGQVPAAAALPQASQAAVRVRAPLLDRLVNHAGEVSITRARIEAEVVQLKSAISDLGENLERMRGQLRDIELQAETQIESRLEAAKSASAQFDPLEMDRFTRFQELTRMMAESVNDVATVQRGLQRTLQSTEDELASQARLTRDMQEDLLRTRMVEFEGLSERLYRVVRQAAKETGKQVRLDIVGGSMEVDRGVLERMTAAFEHLLRNCVAHGIELPEQRLSAGKEATGSITVVVTQEGNEVGVEVRDDGGGLDLQRIADKARAQGLIAPAAQPSEGELAALVFVPGFTTADSITGLAGRGVGMDVVRSDVNAMGGRIETTTSAGKGTSFRLVLPLTTAVTQVVMLRCGELTVAVPSTLVEIVRRAKPAEVAQAYASASYAMGDQSIPFFWLGALLQGSALGLVTTRTAAVVVIRSAAQRVALHVDEVLGNQEVVVKNLGPQLARLPGLAGMTLLPSGQPALIYNPVALATLYGDSARAATQAVLSATRGDGKPVDDDTEDLAPLVLVVDDSLTVRRVTQRLLVREGYRVSLAKDGLEGLERLSDERPAVLLTDIEMPRMDGFDLVRNLRADPKLASLPVIMITSRIAQKHRDYAVELGVNHYLGKPYSEEDLLALVARYARATQPV